MPRKREPPRCKDDKHDWAYWKTIYVPDYNIGIGAVRVCKKCKWREYNDWCSTRTGTSFVILPPENDNNG